jgi:hypothetical protein
MPNPDGKLTEKEKSNAIAWIEARGADNTVCSGCAKSQQWLISDHMASIPGGGNFPSRSFPAIVLICQTCGMFRFHSAIAAGVVKADVLDMLDQKETPRG